ncbi:2-dehydro-3-deoxygalactonokinase [Novosphingobium sp.]|uniref:2-dehydro-3-deoxygalactonokinase n=1 Tax=Novosphingobium sp. TaxID=1874826 RepID=UPI0031DA215F
MSRVAEQDIVGINWGSSNFRAYRIAADGSLIDDYAAPRGVAGLDRGGMAAMLRGLAERWPGHGPAYASGMIGSNIGWAEAPYADAPAGADDIAGSALSALIGETVVRIVPGVACRRAFDDAPDVMRGEEVELLGLVAMGHGDGVAALPGTHTKWVRLEGGRIVDFFTAMSGEIYDRLTGQGLLASIVEGEAREGEAFQAGVATGRLRRLGLGTLLFGARARVMRGDLPRGESASYIRGLLIGAEIADALDACPGLAEAPVPLIGNEPLSRLYAAALASVGVESRLVASRDACLRGFCALHERLVAAMR